MILTQNQVNLLSEQELKGSPSYKEYLGAFHFRDRMKFLAELSCKSGPGDIIEIGVLSGDTSVILAGVAKEYGRKFVGIDNWPTTGVAASYRLDLCEQAYYKTMEPMKSVAETWRVEAHSPETLQRIRDRQWAFALSDDGHQYEDHLAELLALMPTTTGVIAADDINYHTHVTDAMRDAILKNPQWTSLFGTGLREGYLVRT